METTLEQQSQAVRQIQALAVLLSCMPANGKAREFFSLALSLDESPWLERITPVTDPARDEGIQAWLRRVDGVSDVSSNNALTSWLECLWLRSDLSSGDQTFVDWQAEQGNMSGAVAEYLAVLGTLRQA